VRTEFGRVVSAGSVVILGFAHPSYRISDCALHIRNLCATRM